MPFKYEITILSKKKLPIIKFYYMKYSFNSLLKLRETTSILSEFTI